MVSLHGYYVQSEGIAGKEHGLTSQSRVIQSFGSLDWKLTDVTTHDDG